MKSINTDDFSPIFYANEKPERDGWYCSPFTKDEVKKAHSGNMTLLQYSTYYRWWNGRIWSDYPGGYEIVQRRVWFGLNREIKS